MDDSTDVAAITRSRWCGATRSPPTKIMSASVAPTDTNTSATSAPAHDSPSASAAPAQTTTVDSAQASAATQSQSGAASHQTGSHHVDKPGEGAAVGIPPSMQEIKLGENVTSGAGTEGSMSGEVGPDGYPEQAHAGQLGLGPNYHKHPTTGDKISGTMEEIKGKILRKPEVAQHGADKKSGALFEEEAAKDASEDPFAKPEGGDKTTPVSQDTKHNAATNSTKTDA
ncbi:hypothetical protein OIO90_003588 [Microbotryomycetes sp. JL221]|nr:hypothetical protein OIO90_003588 [Microbotryomycetes sp. JL221]